MDARKCAATFGQQVVKGIFCNYLVCMAVFLATQARDMAGGIMTDQRSAWPRPNGPAYTYREISESEADALHLQTALRNKDWETAGRVLRGMTFVERPNFREAHAATQEVVDSCW